MSTPIQKIGASTVNCSLILLITFPFYPVLGLEAWKLLTIGVFFLYNMIFRTRCIGMRLVGTYIRPPTTTLYAVLYTAGFSTFFYHIVFPFDLLILNGIAQIWSITMTGNTLHALIADQATMTRLEYLARCKLEATALLVDRKPYQAVQFMREATEPWRDIRQPKWIFDMGYVLALEGNAANLKAWIDGFQ